MRTKKLFITCVAVIHVFFLSVNGARIRREPEHIQRMLENIRNKLSEVSESQSDIPPLINKYDLWSKHHTKKLIKKIVARTFAEYDKTVLTQAEHRARAILTRKPPAIEEPVKEILEEKMLVLPSVVEAKNAAVKAAVVVEELKKNLTMASPTELKEIEAQVISAEAVAEKKEKLIAKAQLKEAVGNVSESKAMVRRVNDVKRAASVVNDVKQAASGVNAVKRAAQAEAVLEAQTKVVEAVQKVVKAEAKPTPTPPPVMEKLKAAVETAVADVPPPPPPIEVPPPPRKAPTPVPANARKVNVDLPAQNWTDPNVGTVLKMYKEFQDELGSLSTQQTEVYEELQKKRRQLPALVSAPSPSPPKQPFDLQREVDLTIAKLMKEPVPPEGMDEEKKKQVQRRKSEILELKAREDEARSRMDKAAVIEQQAKEHVATVENRLSIAKEQESEVRKAVARSAEENAQLKIALANSALAQKDMTSKMKALGTVSP